MTLRRRLILASALILALIALGGVLLLRTQGAYMTAQVDDELEAARPIARFPILDDIADAPPRPDAPISDLFLGYVDDGELVPTLAGELVDDVPELDTSAAGIEAVVNGDPFTVDGQDGRTRFRVAVARDPGSGRATVVALPLDEVDSAVNRLQWALGAGTLVIAGMLLLALWWVERFGLRAVARLTATADAVASGDRDRRALDANPRTEAGKLATAFNVMLDQRDASEARLRRFVADASHELRTPLTSIRGYLDLYREGGFRADGQLDDVVRRMSHEASRMHDLVEDLLLLAQLDQHRPLRQERVDIEPLLRNAATDARVLQPHRPVVVTIDGDEALEAIGDPFRLQQVVGALVANALAYTDPDSEIRLSAARAEDDIEVTIADSGPGLEPDDAARAFDRFFRGERSRARRTGGSGLGLAIARSIVEAHHGTITLHTAPGAGCRFDITLPSAIPPADQAPTDRHPSAAATPPSATSPSASAGR